ncbi:hypothetical protein RSOLAG22IIIB_11641 [Rhizoctonia solani]|uniref:Uncharacterized protein n=1 Tax=Rhizoctonia solani TaxID=456999 RepID=A0A0K6G9L3_9AGAM|nr:hypothetical protein RSOLAG22IIIB_11641 [Rhizoctonia solani]
MAGPSRARSPAAAAPFPSFARAMSPAVIGTIVHAHREEAPARVGASAMAKSWTEVLDCVSPAYKEALRELFKDLHGRAIKFHACEAALEWLKAGQNDAKPPPPVQGLHEPHWQVAKEFALSEGGSHLLTDISSAHQNYVSAAWEAGIELKKAEHAFHLNRLTTESWWPPILAVVEDVYSKMDRLAPAFAQVEGQEAVVYEESHALALEHSRLKEALPDLCLRVLALEKAKVLADANKLRNKAKLKEAADVEMADGTKADSLAVKQMVQAEVRRVLAQNPQQAKGTPPSNANKGKGKGAQVKAPKSFVRKHKGKTGHIDQKTGLPAPLHYGPKQKQRRQGGKKNGQGKQAGSSKQSK